MQLAEIQHKERKNRKPTHLNSILQESNQKEEMKRMSNVVQGVSNRGCWNTTQYNAQLHETNQEEERKNQEINIIGMTLSQPKEATRVVLLLMVIMLDW
jgi:hypothetical protein